MKLCTYCGGENPDEAQFCGHCGETLESIPPKKKSHWKAVLAITLAVALVLGLGWLFLSHRMERELIRAGSSAYSDFMDLVETNDDLEAALKEIGKLWKEPTVALSADLNLRYQSLHSVIHVEPETKKYRMDFNLNLGWGLGLDLDLYADPEQIQFALPQLFSEVYGFSLDRLLEETKVEVPENEADVPGFQDLGETELVIADQNVICNMYEAKWVRTLDERLEALAGNPVPAPEIGILRAYVGQDHKLKGVDWFMDGHWNGIRWEGVENPWDTLLLLRDGVPAYRAALSVDAENALLFIENAQNGKPVVRCQLSGNQFVWESKKQYIEGTLESSDKCIQVQGNGFTLTLASAPDVPAPLSDTYVDILDFIQSHGTL